MEQQRLIRLFFFVLIGVMMLYDFFFNSLSQLMSEGGVINLAEELGMTLQQTQIRLIASSVLSLAAGIGALMAAQTYLSPDASKRNGRIGLAIAVSAMALYGLFNMVSAVIWVNTTLRMPILLTGVTYLVLAFGVWYAGRDLRGG